MPEKRNTGRHASPKVFVDRPIDDRTETLLASCLTDNDIYFKDVFDGCSDVVFRSFRIGDALEALLVFIDGLTDEKQLVETVMKPLQSSATKAHESGEGLLPYLQNVLIPNSQAKASPSALEVEQGVLKGSVALFVDGQSEALLLSLPGGNVRAVEEPSTETTIRGPRDSFTEILRTNTSLIRRKVKSSRLKIDMFTVGDLTKTDIAVISIKGIANDSVLEEIKSRIKSIRTEMVLESGYIEQWIEKKTFSPFPQFFVTERPDYLVSVLLEGQVAILTDGSPFAVSAPMTFWGFLQAGEDYYERVLYANMIRAIRLLFTMIALLLPSFYVALTTFHQQMIPTNLLLSISAAREGVPFPALVEALIMEVTFEGLREAGVRLPKQVGQAVSIVGGLVVGQAAVQAGIVSAPMVIVVSLTGIASFTIPRYNFSIAFRLLRFPLILLGGILGLYGISIGLLVILVHLSGLKSFGVPYLFPAAPVSFRILKDALFRAPLWTLYMHQQKGSRK